tara:strand:+ start:426 stop:2483 length:2058 start_codon:yes stop_codon:yes gene_type:complete
MPSVHFRDQAVFGGGGGSGGGNGVAQPAPPVFKSSKPELSGQEYASQELLNQAEAVVDKDNAAISEYKKAIAQSVSATSNEGTDEIGSLQLKLQAVQAVAKPAVTYNSGMITAAFNDQVRALNTKLQSAQQVGQTEVESATRGLVKKAVIDPASLTTKAEVAELDPNTLGATLSQQTGQLSSDVTATPTADVAPTATAAGVDPITTATATTGATQPAITTATEATTAAQGQLTPQAILEGATKDPTTTDVKDLTAAQGTATVMNNPVQREIQAGEIVSGAADAAKAATFTEQIQAATATPSDQATVKGQLDNLMQDFEGGATPTWAAGAMRNANAQMAARGLGASSMAGQAIIQAAMESAIPIAAQDAQIVAGFEMANLSNRQARAMLAAEQRAQFMGMEFTQDFQARVQNSARIGEIANMNFTADQQVALENSRNANSMNLANLTNAQAMVMGQAAAISALEQQNLSNQQQAAVQNAQSFLQMDMANLGNRQQTEMFKAQSVIQSIFTDQAAENAAKQFNASSENQTKQFMANMQAQVQQFNASQKNAMEQFAVTEENAMSKFNVDMMNQREKFNATNQLVVSQANAQWRQNVATLNTNNQNLANQEAAKISNAFTASTMDQIWQRERDLMSMAWKSSESSADRANNILLTQMTVTAQKEALALQASAEKSSAFGSFLASMIFG